jgi:hypothetical protein
MRRTEAMNERPVTVNLQGIKQQIPTSVGVPLQVPRARGRRDRRPRRGRLQRRRRLRALRARLLVAVILDFMVTEQSPGGSTQGGGAASDGQQAG